VLYLTIFDRKDRDMNFGKILLVGVGIFLIVTAFISASGIPEAAQKDFDRLVRNAGGHMSHTPNFPDAYKQMSSNRRLLQNFYIGAAGLICLAVGLSNCTKTKPVKQGASEDN
jgi:ABC-type lipoprotein release transport system permease subunit